MRAIWKGAVAFGLVNVPVKLYAATGEHEVPLHQVHRTDGGRIRYRRTCSVCGEPVDMADIAKGYETDDGQLVVLTDEDMAELPLATEREIAVLEFVPAEQVDPILLAKTYYLEPDRTAAKPYALLREALATTDRMAVVKVALRQRESKAVLRVRDDVICLQTLLWPDEVREADFPILDADVSVRPQELAMASSLVESLAADFDPSGFEDSYRAALESLIEAKVSAGSTQEAPVREEGPGGGEGGGEVVDLLAALQRSVEKARSARGAGEEAPTGGRGRGRTASSAAPAKSSGARSSSKSASAKTAAPTKAAPKATASAQKTGAPAKAASKATTSRGTASKSTASKSTASGGSAPKRAAATSTAAARTASKSRATKAEPASTARARRGPQQDETTTGSARGTRGARSRAS